MVSKASRGGEHMQSRVLVILTPSMKEAGSLPLFLANSGADLHSLNLGGGDTSPALGLQAWRHSTFIIPDFSRGFHSTKPIWTNAKLSIKLR